MRVARDYTPLNPSPTHAIRTSSPTSDGQPCGTDPGQDKGIVGAVKLLADAVDRLAGAIEKQNRPLGDGDRTRYTRASNDSDLLDERTMAEILHISYRTLGNHRRQGRLPNCWIRNGGRIMWKVAETRKTWERGIA